jgi:hypothetical protein
MEESVVHIQIQLTEEQIRALTALAAERGVPVAELIQQSIDTIIRSSVGLDGPERRQRAKAAAGKFRSGTGDIAVHHDRYLTKAYTE